MPVKHISPSVNVVEIDKSSYTLPPTKTSLFLIGEASKGEINTPTQVTDTEDLAAKFGKELDNAFLVQTAKNYLNYSSDLLIVRAAYDQDIVFTGTVRETYNITGSNNKIKIAIDGEVTGKTITLDTFAAASANQLASNITAKLADSSITSIEGVQTDSKRVNLEADNTVKKVELQDVTGSIYDTLGWLNTEADGEIERAWYAMDNITYTEPPTLTSGTLTSADWSSLTGSEVLYIKENNNDTVSYTFEAVATGLLGSTIASRIASQLESQRDTDETSYYFSAVGDTITLVGSSLATNQITHGQSNVGTILGGDFDIAEGSTVATAEATTILGKIRARTKGTDGNLFTVTYGLNSFNEDTLYVYYNSETSPVEELTGWNFDESDSDNYIEEYVANNSDYIDVVWDVEGTDYFDMKTYTLSGGQNGINTAMTTQRVAALSTDAKNPELYTFNLVAMPGEYSTTGIQSLISFCQDTRADCFAIVDSPMSLDADDIVTWHNGESDGNAVKFNSSYAALYWPWLLGTNADTGLNIWYPPTVYMPALYAKSDFNFDPWYPPAGATRGVIPGVYLDVETSPEISKRDVMYGKAGNNVNPIVTFKSLGTLVWGQKTLLRSLSALDRVNVRRMVLYVEKGIVDIAQPLLFELNTPVNWQLFTDRANRFLADVKRRYGLEDYLVVCDSTTNTPDIIDQNKMVGKIFLKPVKAIEVIDLYFTITSSGGTFTE